MTLAQPTMEHCQHCRQKQEVRFVLSGDKTIMRCTGCSNWIRCQDCRYIKSIDHDCPMNNKD